MMWLVWCCCFVVAVALGLVLLCVAIHVYYRTKYLDQIVRIFEEKPLFIIPRGKPEPNVEDVSFRAVDGAKLCGCYLKHRSHTRRGVILFGLEFGSNRWAAIPYCDKLRDAGYDVFAYEPRNQGDSETETTYAPMQWVTHKDVADARAAAKYLKSRPDADPRGYGLFGISKGGSVGLLLAAEDPDVRCVATDGAFATYTTVVPYMRRWVSIYSSQKTLQKIAPDFLYGSIAISVMNHVAEKRQVKFPFIERSLKNLTTPVFMIHGQADTYIKPDMAKSLFAKVGATEKTLWLVAKAKHNQAPQIEPILYHEKLVDFFETHLGDLSNTTDSALELETLPVPRLIDTVAMPALAARELAPLPRLANAPG
jgi:uncharacterized protein